MRDTPVRRLLFLVVTAFLSGVRGRRSQVIPRTSVALPPIQRLAAPGALAAAVAHPAAPVSGREALAPRHASMQAAMLTSSSMDQMSAASSTAPVLLGPTAQRGLVGDWCLEWTDEIPAFLRQALTREVAEAAPNISLRLSIDDAGSLAASAVIALPDGSEKRVEGNGDELDVEYVNDDVLLTRPRFMEISGTTPLAFWSRTKTAPEQGGGRLRLTLDELGNPTGLSAALDSPLAMAAPALAPDTVTKPSPGVPTGIDPSRFGEKVRWLYDEQAEKPPSWRVLLLDKTFERSENTVLRVAACLVQVLGLSIPAARASAQQAYDHFFSVVVTSPEFNRAIRKAKDLQYRRLVVRVVPGVTSA